MRANSLALRLFFSATTWIVVILVVAGIVLSGVYRAAVERAFDRRLGVYLRTLVADVATPDDAADRFPAVARRAAVRAAAVGLVLAGDAARHRAAGDALLALAVGFDARRISTIAASRPRRAAPARAMSTGPRSSACA